jgi:diadenosine tetraphosphate (Ap4A) HIT family hydrolase
MTETDCALCAGSSMDDALMVVETWADELWRLTTATVGEVAGFSYLIPRRHISSLDLLDGREAATLGSTLASCAAAVRGATGADEVYVFSFGGVGHAHFQLAPHRPPTSPLIDDPIKGNKHEVTLPDGQQVWASDRYPLAPRDLMDAAVAAIRSTLAPEPSEPEGDEDLA